MTTAPSAKSDFDGNVLLYLFTRNTPGQQHAPRVDKKLGWLLAFSPSDGRQRQVMPGERVWLSTGLKLMVPSDTTARLSHYHSPMRSDLWIPCLEVRGDHKGELIVPFRNELNITANINPGQYVFRLDLIEDEEEFLITIVD